MIVTKFILIINANLDNEFSIYLSRKRLKIELGNVFDFKEVVGWKIVAFNSHMVYFAIRHVDKPFKLFVFRRTDCSLWLCCPFLFITALLPRKFACLHLIIIFS